MSEFSPDDCAFMARALRLAERGRYTAHPNPVVGCVVVSAGKTVGEGWHRIAGAAHAEVNALDAAGDLAADATAYVTLEPCAHQGRTAPCVDALLKARISRVVIATEDPNPQVAGQGASLLSKAGVDVTVGLMRAEAERINAGFLKRMLTRRPFVRLKLATSLDGAIAMQNGESQWITGTAARADVQKLRARSGAVMTGIGTVLADDPSLNVRSAAFETAALQPLRVVLDSQLRLPDSARMLTLPGETLVCIAAEASRRAISGAEVKCFPATNGRVSIEAVLEELANRDVNELLVESGPTLAGQMLENNLVDELVIYQAPHIMGSCTRRLVNTPTWSTLADRRKLSILDSRRIGDDTRITATLIKDA